MSMLKNKRVLITGASGFVGSCLARALADGANHIGLFVLEHDDLWRVNDIASEFSILTADLRDYSTVRRQIREFEPDIVFHLATFGAMSGQEDDNRIVETNVLACANLVLALAETDYSAFVNVGSSSEYGPKSKPMSENDVPEPQTSYGRSKLAATMLCQASAVTNDKPNVTLRLFSPYGYFEDARRLVPSVILSCLRGENPELGSPESVRDFVFIEDVVDALLMAAVKIDAGQGKIINVGSGVQHSVGEITSKIIKLTGGGLDPRWGVVKRSQNEPQSWQADTNQAAELLGWQPRHDLDSGLAKTVDWFRENISLYETCRGEA